MSSVTNHLLHPDQRPERSRNAKAQARHRAKRKAYIEQLEQTVTKLQTALGYTPEELETLPPPLVKIRELEQENARLEKENEDLRRMLADTGRAVPPDIARRTALSTFQDTRSCDHGLKRRKIVGPMDGTYVHSNENTPQQHVDPIRPPPLTIPTQPVSHPYSYAPSNNSSAHSALQNGSSSMFNLHAPAFQMPHTPSSSANSSPPFSPAPMQEPLQQPPLHRPTSSQLISSYSHTQGHRPHQYDSVKVEDERYPSNQHSPQQTNGHYDPHAAPHGYGHPPANHNAHPTNTDSTNMNEGQWNHAYDPRTTHHHLHR